MLIRDLLKRENPILKIIKNKKEKRKGMADLGF